MAGTRNPAFDALLEEIRILHNGKSHDYANADPLSNLRMCEAFGVPALQGVLVRMSDKWSRVVQLAGGKTPKHESLRDTLIDTAVYSLLAVILLDEQSGTVASDSGLTAEPVGPLGFVIPESRKMSP